MSRDFKSDLRRSHGKLDIETSTAILSEDNTIADNSSGQHRLACTRPKGTILTIWRKEIAACAFVIGVLVVMTTTLKLIDNRSVPSLPLNMSINTLIAIFAASIQAAGVYILGEGISQSKWNWYQRPRKLYDFAVYDDASRGPWGALKLLLNLRCRPVIASIGAFTTIIAVILTPVSQQVIRFEQGSEVVSNALAKLPRTSVYNAPNETLTLSSTSFSTTGQHKVLLPTTELLGAMAAGQFSLSKPHVPFICDTGNCTFAQTYSTVGYCSSCIDVSDKLTIRTTPFTYESLNGVMWCRFEIMLQSDNGKRRGFNATTWRIRSRMFMSYYDDIDGNLNMIWYDADETRNDCPDKVEARAYQCDLFPCIQTLQARVTNMQLYEQVTERIDMFGRTWRTLGTGYKEATYHPVVNVQCLDTTSRRDLQDLGYELNADTRWLPYNVSWQPGLDGGNYTFLKKARTILNTTAGAARGFYSGNNSHIELTDQALRVVPGRCIYQVMNGLPYTLQMATFASYFDGNVSSDDRTKSTIGSPAAVGLYMVGRKGNSPQPLQAVAGMMQNITDSMTAYMRWHGDVYASEPVIGETHHSTVLVRVQWICMIYLSAFAGLLLVFFVSMVYNTKMTQLKAQSRGLIKDSHGTIVDSEVFNHDFKSNALATLLHGLDQETLQMIGHIGAANHTEGIMRESTKHLVMLVQTEQGWKLTRVGD